MLKCQFYIQITRKCAEHSHLLQQFNNSTIDQVETHLSLAVDSNDAASSLMRSSHEDGISTDAVHVNTRSSLDVVHMNVAVLCDQVDHIILGAYLVK